MKTATDVRWLDRKVGERFAIDLGGGRWVSGEKVSPDTFAKDGGETVVVSAWTKTR